MARHGRTGGGRGWTGPSLATFPELATVVSRTPGRGMKMDPPSLPGRAMQSTTATRILRTALLVIVIGGSVAAALGVGAWHLLPYAALKADTAAGRFAIWEGAMWGLGLAATLFGMAALLNATDLSSIRSLHQVTQQAHDARQGRTLYSDLPAVPWVLLACGVALLVVAVAARSVGVG